MSRLFSRVSTRSSAETQREVQTVHSSHGRLRVHLPHWSGTGGDAIASRLREVSGVTDAQASGLTGNVLILFNPRQTSPDLLIPELLALPVPAVAAPARSRIAPAAPPPKAAEPARPLAEVAAPNGSKPYAARPFRYLTGFRRLVYQLLGWTSVGMAVVGAIMPGIPTAPFVVLAGYFFIRSSPPAHEWLLRSRWFGPMLRDWEEYHAITRSVRNAAAGLIAFGAVFVSVLGLPLSLLVSIYAMQLLGVVIVLRLPVIDRPAPALLAAAR